MAILAHTMVPFIFLANAALYLPYLANTLYERTDSSDNAAHAPSESGYAQ